MQRTTELKVFQQKLIENGLVWAKSATTRQLVEARQGMNTEQLNRYGIL